MVPCDVSHYASVWKVTFADGSTLLLQTDYDQAAFAVDSGALKAPESWDGRPSTLPGFVDLDVSEIDQCSEEYYDQAKLED